MGLPHSARGIVVAAGRVRITKLRTSRGWRTPSDEAVMPPIERQTKRTGPSARLWINSAASSAKKSSMV